MWQVNFWSFEFFHFSRCMTGRVDTGLGKSLVIVRALVRRKERCLVAASKLVVVPIFFLLKFNMATWARHLYMLSRAGWESLIIPLTGVFFCTSMYLCKTSMFCQPRCILLLHSRWQIHDEDRNAQGVCSFKTNSKRVCSSDQTSTQGSETRDSENSEWMTQAIESSNISQCNFSVNQSSIWQKEKENVCVFATAFEEKYLSWGIMTTSKTIQRPWLFDFWAFIVFGFRNEFLVSGVEPWNLKIAPIL